MLNAAHIGREKSSLGLFIYLYLLIQYKLFLLLKFYTLTQLRPT